MGKALCPSKTTREPVKCHSERMTFDQCRGSLPNLWPDVSDALFPTGPAESSLMHQKTRNYQEAVIPWSQYSMEIFPIVLDVLYSVTDFTSLALSLQQLLAQLHFKNSTCLAHSQNFKHFGLYFCIRIGINIMEQNLTKTPVHYNACWSIVIDH